MTELLTFIIAHFSFLYEDYEAHFANSVNDRGDAMILFNLGHLRLRFVHDRGQLFVHLQSQYGPSRKNWTSYEFWYSYDLVQQLITGEIDDDGLLDESKANFMKDHMEEILRLFSRKNHAATEEALNEFKKSRAKRVFG